MKEKVTPLMRQYNQIKGKYPDTILLFRLGDFFETFNEDAVTTAKVCGITLTKRNNGAAGKCPLAGFPHHQLDAYLPKLVRAGYRVAVCDQLEDPKASRGIVRRGVTEVVTPGVALYDRLLETKKNNYLAAIYIGTIKNIKIIAVSCIDISTGEFFTGEFPAQQLSEVLETLVPSEIIISKAQKQELIVEIDKLSYNPSITKLEPWVFDKEFGREAILGQFKTKSLKGFGIESYDTAIAASGAILYYINETQSGRLDHIRNINLFTTSDYMILDFATRKNLEITFSMNEATNDGTLISILDKTITPMGGRLFKKWITRPLINIDKINERLTAVRVLFDNQEARGILRNIMNAISDMERLITKICTGRANPRDLISLKESLLKIPEVQSTINPLKSEYIKLLEKHLNPLNKLIELISTAIVDEPSAQLGTANVFRSNYSQELDKHVDAKFSGKTWVANYQETERIESGISSLKVGYNSVFGYYIEITKTHKNRVPEHYDRRQTLTNAERYITPELKEIEEKILSAEENIAELELSLFTELRMKVAVHTEIIQRNSLLIAELDCLQSFAESAQNYNYCQPQIDESSSIEIIEGRHPVVERLLEIGNNFTANSTGINIDNEQIHIITGPNMSGKSCYLRQVALIILLGQIGSFVPAKKAKFGLVDRIFTRVGAQDNISAGESTFLVEMQEAANIMNNATDKSLILLDEVGRGTATFDGIAIAWAITEYLHNNICAKTLFATHYHELNELAERYEKIINYKVEVLEAGDTIIFTHKVLPGTSDHSFGIHVAEMAGLPKEITERAEIIMRAFESEESDSVADRIKAKQANTSAIQSNKFKNFPEQLSIFEFRDDAIREQIMKLKINNLTPIDALKILSEMKKKVKKPRR